MSKTFRTWDQYADEAKIEPFELKISDDETLTFENPTGVALMRIAQGIRSGDIVLILSSLAGDQWSRLEELFGGIGHKALPALTEDLMEHFELYEDVTLVGPGGGKVTARRPTRIKALIEQGYRPVGEAGSRT
jgi:hypothetical protein